MPVSLRIVVAAAVSLVLMVTVSCASSGENRQSSGGRFGTVRLPPEQIQSDLMGFVDSYVAIIEDAQARSSEGQPIEYRSFLHSILTRSVQAIMNIAADSNPATSLLDVIVTVSLTKEIIDDQQETDFMERRIPIHEAFQILEEDIWEIADRALFPEQQEALRGLIEELHDRFPNLRNVTSLRASDYAATRGSGASAQLNRQSSGNLLRMFQLDPLAGLDPARHELLQSRLLAERAFFFARRTPMLVNMQVRDVILRTLAMPESQGILLSIYEFADASDSFAETADQLAVLLPQERNAAIEQIADVAAIERQALIDGVQATLAGEREALRAMLGEDDEQLRGLLGELRETLDSAHVASESVRATVDSLDRLISADDSGTTSGESAPFDILEYQATAESLTVAAVELGQLTNSLQSLLDAPGWAERETEFQAASDRAQAGLAQLIDRAFQRGLLLVGALITGLLAVGVAMRFIRVRQPSA